MSATELRTRYQAAGLSDGEVSKLVVLDIKNAAYFEDFFEREDTSNQHSAGNKIIAEDDEIMIWLFSHSRV